MIALQAVWNIFSSFLEDLCRSEREFELNGA